MRTRATLIALLLTSTTVTAACSSGGASGGGAGGGQLTVVGTEMAFAAPDSVAAGDYSVTFRNDGVVAHELAFKGPDGRFVARRSIPGKQSVVLEVELTKGTWELGCFEPGHYEAGMHKSLVVT